MLHGGKHPLFNKIGVNSTIRSTILMLLQAYLSSLIYNKTEFLRINNIVPRRSFITYLLKNVLSSKTKPSALGFGKISANSTKTC